MVSTAGWTTAARWPLITTRSARYAPVATDRKTRADRRISRAYPIGGSATLGDLLADGNPRA
jgi:hypothetical protein